MTATPHPDPVATSPPFPWWGLAFAIGVAFLVSFAVLALGAFLVLQGIRHGPDGVGPLAAWLPQAGMVLAAGIAYWMGWRRGLAAR